MPGSQGGYPGTVTFGEICRVPQTKQRKNLQALNDPQNTMHDRVF